MFDVFAPAADDIDATHDRWLEREPGIWERAVWDTDTRTLTLSVRREPETETAPGTSFFATAKVDDGV